MWICVCMCMHVYKSTFLEISRELSDSIVCIRSKVSYIVSKSSLNLKRCNPFIYKYLVSIYYGPLCSSESESLVWFENSLGWEWGQLSRRCPGTEPGVTCPMSRLIVHQTTHKTFWPCDQHPGILEKVRNAKPLVVQNRSFPINTGIRYVNTELKLT